MAGIVDGTLIGFGVAGVALLAAAVREGSEGLAIAVFVLGYVLVLFLVPAHWAARALPSSPGKRLMKLHVIGTEGGDIGFGRGLLRITVLWLGSLVFYLGWLWMLWDKRRQAWHDHAARSLVVQGEVAPATAGPTAPDDPGVAGAPGIPGSNCPVCGFALDRSGHCRVCGRQTGVTT